jgi:para-nitrobenzyl esterase
MRPVLLALLTTAACATHIAPTSEPQPAWPVVGTTEGHVVGVQDGNGVTSFLGVPYAAPPVGDARWTVTAAPPRHNGITAAAYHLPCAQIPIPAGSDSLAQGQRIDSSEDCLHLNIWVPPHDPGERLPVMVWSHGGQYLRGATSQYDGEQLARLGHVVVVTVAYRLGPLGFLAHPALTAEPPWHASGNQALFDHIQALSWLRSNLPRFGGDPERITLFGESAGGATTCALLGSPLATGLFHRAILMSGPCVGYEDTPTLEQREAFGRSLGAALGCKDDDPAREIACMRGKSVEQVMTAIPLAKVLGTDDNAVGYRFNLDNVLLLKNPTHAIASNDIVKIPVMLGTVDDEMGRYIVGLGVDSLDEYRAHLNKRWPGNAERLLAAYPVQSPADVPRQLAAVYSDWAMTCPARRDARALTAAGNTTYLYRFHRAPNILGGKFGTFHGSELAYLFPSAFKNHDFVQTDEDQRFARTMIGYWSRFAATGDPNGAAAPTWPVHDERDWHLDLDVEPRMGARLNTAKCDIWDTVPD